MSLIEFPPKKEVVKNISLFLLQTGGLSGFVFFSKYANQLVSSLFFEDNDLISENNKTPNYQAIEETNEPQTEESTASSSTTSGDTGLVTTQESETTTPKETCATGKYWHAIIQLNYSDGGKGVFGNWYNIYGKRFTLLVEIKSDCSYTFTNTEIPHSQYSTWRYGKKPNNRYVFWSRYYDSEQAVKDAFKNWAVARNKKSSK